MPHILRMPEIAAGTGEAAIQAWLVKPGDKVAVGQAVCEIETDKATIDLEAEESGTFAGELVEAGRKVAVGSPIGVIAELGEDLAAVLAAAGSDVDDEAPSADTDMQDAVDGDLAKVDESAAPGDTTARLDDVSEEAPGADQSDAPTESGRPERLMTSPLVRRLAREQNLDLSTVKGSGPNGRILKKDLARITSPTQEKHAEPTAQNAVASQPSGSVDEGQWDVLPHSGMRRAVARRLSESKATVPHFYVVADCKMDDLLTLRAQVNAIGDRKVSVNDFIIKAAAQAMRDVPAMNAVWGDDGMRRARRVDIAVAVAVEDGLFTPVVRDADTLSMGRLAETVRDLAERARSGGLKQRDLEGGTFTISNLGMYGTKEFSAIINRRTPASSPSARRRSGRWSSTVRSAWRRS